MSIVPEPKLRILQAGPTAFGGGVTSAVKMQCLGLRKLGHEVALFTDGRENEDLRARGIECHVTDVSTRPRPLAESVLELRRLLRSFRPDVIHVHGRSFALRCFLAGRQADWFTLHSTHLTDQKGFYDTGLVRRYLSPWGKNFFVLNDDATHYLAKEFGVARDRIVQVPNGVDCDRFRVPTPDERAAARAAFGVTPEQTFVVCIGRLHPIKQPEAVVAAAARARRTGRTDVRFAIVGDGPLRESLKQQIDEVGVSDLCTMHGWMEPLEAYFAADLVVLPSLFEGYGLVAAEAIATGCPVLRSRTGGTAETIREGVSGFACDVPAEAFVDRLFEVLADPSRLVPMRKTAREFAENEMDFSIAARKVTSSYRSRMPASRAATTASHATRSVRPANARSSESPAQNEL